MKYASIIKAWFSRNQAALMLGTGIAGMVTTTVLAVRGHMKAKDKIDVDHMDLDEYAKATVTDKKKRVHIKKRYWIKKTWKCYVPAAVTGTLSIACLIASHRVNQRRNAALASSLAVSEAAMTEYQKQVIDTVGEDVERDIREKFHQKQIEKNPEGLKEPETRQLDNYIGGDMSVNVVESTTGQKFWASKEDIRRAVNNLNQERLTGFGGQVTLNDFYIELGMAATSAGDCLGWKLDNPIDVDISAVEVNGIPCLYVTPLNWVNLC